jgi:hypothetical protein
MIGFHTLAHLTGLSDDEVLLRVLVVDATLNRNF